jgi:hypothetical protein
MSQALFKAKVDNTTLEYASNQIRIKDLGVTTAKINDLAVTTGKINDLGVTTGKINDLAVTTGKINDLGVTEGKIAAGAVATTKLKTATGEVSTDSNDLINLTLPGGEYGFYPQIKTDNTEDEFLASMLGDGATLHDGLVSYTTNITMKSNGVDDVFAKHRYVTASGLDLWIFLLQEKATGKILATYTAPDHPLYGNGGDISKVPHPFFMNDLSKLAAANGLSELEIVVLNKDEVAKIKTEAAAQLLSVTEYIKKNCMVDNSETKESWTPTHTGKFIDEEPELIDVLPQGIEVRKLKAKE